MNHREKVHCPHCNTENTVQYEFVSPYVKVRTVLVCDEEAGGCGKLFVVEAEAVVLSLVFEVHERQKRAKKVVK